FLNLYCNKMILEELGRNPPDSGANVSVAPSYDENNMEIVDQCNYICIPLSKFCSESTTESPYENTNADMNADTNYNYKLIDQFPSDTQHCMYRKKSYVMLYDTAKKNAKWVYEILNKSTVPYHYKKVTFRKDNNIDDDKQALNSTKGFKDKDYVRGHLAAAANHMWCQEAYNDTYLISNMTPQIKSINNGIWKTLEYYCRNIIYNDDRVRNVHVYTGPLYLNNEGLTMEEKAVPTHYFKVVIVENVNGKAKVEYNQEKKKRENIRLKNYIVDIEEIEKKSGLPFTHKIDSNKRNCTETTGLWDTFRHQRSSDK
uniref:Uncharacterized protein n=1 Tax=Cyprinus carpio TaxID=7962 RepID=A0A8C1ZC09_CYPCA